MADNGINVRQNDIVQDNQAVHKPYVIRTPSQKNQDMVRNRSW